jgi:hypothetical protein
VRAGRRYDPAPMGLINWIFDFYQQSRIERATEETQQLRYELGRLRTNTPGTGGSLDGQRLERALGELALAVKTVQRIAVDKGICTQAEFVRTMQQIDREDGSEDGRSPVP